jgi:hypothetical protein
MGVLTGSVFIAVFILYGARYGNCDGVVEVGRFNVSEIARTMTIDSSCKNDNGGCTNGMKCTYTLNMSLSLEYTFDIRWLEPKIYTKLTRKPFFTQIFNVGSILQHNVEGGNASISDSTLTDVRFGTDNHDFKTTQWVAFTFQTADKIQEHHSGINTLITRVSPQHSGVSPLSVVTHDRHADSRDFIREMPHVEHVIILPNNDAQLRNVTFGLMRVDGKASHLMLTGQVESGSKLHCSVYRYSFTDVWWKQNKSEVEGLTIAQLSTKKGSFYTDIIDDGHEAPYKRGIKHALAYCQCYDTEERKTVTTRTTMAGGDNVDILYDLPMHIDVPEGEWEKLDTGGMSTRDFATHLNDTIDRIRSLIRTIILGGVLVLFIVIVALRYNAVVSHSATSLEENYLRRVSSLAETSLSFAMAALTGIPFHRAPNTPSWGRRWIVLFTTCHSQAVWVKIHKIGLVVSYLAMTFFACCLSSACFFVYIASFKEGGGTTLSQTVDTIAVWQLMTNDIFHITIWLAASTAVSFICVCLALMPAFQQWAWSADIRRAKTWNVFLVMSIGVIISCLCMINWAHVIVPYGEADFSVWYQALNDIAGIQGCQVGDNVVVYTNQEVPVDNGLTNLAYYLRQFVRVCYSINAGDPRTGVIQLDSCFSAQQEQLIINGQRSIALIIGMGIMIVLFGVVMFYRAALSVASDDETQITTTVAPSYPDGTGWTDGASDELGSHISEDDMPVSVKYNPLWLLFIFGPSAFAVQYYTSSVATDVMSNILWCAAAAAGVAFGLAFVGYMCRLYRRGTEYSSIAKSQKDDADSPARRSSVRKYISNYVLLGSAVLVLSVTMGYIIVPDIWAGILSVSGLLFSGLIQWVKWQ